MAKKVVSVEYLKPKKEKKKPIAERILRGVGKFTGASKLAEMTEPIADLGIMKVLERTNPEAAERMKLSAPTNPALKAMEEGGLKSAVGTIAGQGLEAGAGLSMFATGGLGRGLTGIVKGAGRKANLLSFANSFVGRSAEIAFTKSVGKDLQSKEKAGAAEIFYDASVKGIIAGATSYTLGRAFNRLTKMFANSGAKVTARNYEIPAKMVENDIKYGNNTIAHKISRLGYTGTKKKIVAKALSDKTKFGEQIGAALKNEKGIVLKENVIKDVTKLFDDNIVLEQSQLNLIIKQIDKIDDRMTLTEANNFKRQFANLVPKSAWTSSGSQQDTFRAQLFKSVSAGFRKEIESQVPAITKLNERWAIANDLWNLAGKSRAKDFVGGGVGEILRHGPMATAAEIIKWPVSNTVSRSARNKITNTLTGIGEHELARFMAKFLIIKSE